MAKLDFAEESLVERVQRHYKEAQQHTKTWRSDAREDYGFVDGSMQWSENDAQVLRDQLRPVLTFNRCGPVIDVVTGQEINNRQEVRYIPREQGDKGINEVLTGAAEWVRDGCDAEDEESDAFTDMVTCGMGWTDTRMDYEVDLDGAVIIERIDPLEMHWDTGARKRNLADARWLLRVKEFSRKELEDKWPDKADEVVGPNAIWGDDLNDETPHISHAGDQYANASESTDTKRDGFINVIQYQWWETEEIWRVADPLTGQLTSLTKKQYNEMELLFQEEGHQLQGVKQSRRKYKQAFIAGEIELEEGDCPFDDGFTFKPMTGKRERNTNTWYGLVRSMKDPQRWANKWLSQIMHIINSNAKGGLMAEKDAFENPRRAESEWADPQSITMLKQGALSGQRPKVIPKPPLTFPAGLDKLMEFAVSSIRDVVGVNVDMLGNREGQNTSGIQDFQRISQGVTILASLFNSLRRYRKEQGRVLLHFIQKYLSDGRLIRISGKEGAQYVPLIKQEGIEQFDVVIDDAPSSPNQRERTFSVLSGLLPGLLQAGIPIPPEVIEYAPLPQSLIEKWKETLTQAKGPSQEEVAMLQQGIQFLQAENSKLRNDMQLKTQKQQQEHALKTEDKAFEQNLEAQDQTFDEQMARNEHELDVWKTQQELDIKAMAARDRAN